MKYYTPHNKFHVYRKSCKIHLPILFSSILNIYKRNNNFFNKKEPILEQMKNEITKTFKNSKIFKPFKGNKLLLLFLIEE